MRYIRILIIKRAWICSYSTIHAFLLAPLLLNCADYVRNWGFPVMHVGRPEIQIDFILCNKKIQLFGVDRQTLSSGFTRCYSGTHIHDHLLQRALTQRNRVLY